MRYTGDIEDTGDIGDTGDIVDLGGSSLVY